MQLRKILFLTAFTAAAAAAQTDWLSIVQHKENSSNCGSPGEIACLGFSPLCLAGSSMLSDPYTAVPGQCVLPTACTSVRGISLGSSTSGIDYTFLVITDTHLRNGYGITDTQHLHHAQAINKLPGLRLNWKDARAGFDDKILGITPPASIVSTGDLTDYGQASDLGAFRLLYETGRTDDSVDYSLYPGLGNHDVSGECFLDNCAQRLFAYPPAAAGCATTVDPLSHNYSWDWHQYHMVQLNNWAGDDTLGENETKFLFEFHPTGLDWLAQDLALRVGNSGRPVILFQHYGFDYFSIYNNSQTGDAKPWWSAAQRTQFLNAIAPYNVVALFSGHQHKSAMYSADYQDAAGNNKILDDFTGGSGGIGGHGEFFTVRLTDNFLDVLPIQWTDDYQKATPYMTNVGDAAGGGWPADITWTPEVDQDGVPQPSGTLFYPNFYNNTNGCRKWLGPALKTVPLAVSFDPLNSQNLIVKNTTGAPIQGPFALRLAIPTGAGLNSVSFMGSCAEGPAYQELVSNQLAAGQSETVTLNANGYMPSSFYNSTNLAVVTLGSADSFVVSPGTVTLDAQTPATLSVSTAYGRSIPFTYQADPELTVTVDNNQTPANMTIALNTSAKQIGKTAFVNVQPTVAGYSAAKVVVNLAAVPITVTASGNAPVIADGVSFDTPYTFDWYPGDRHSLSVQGVRQIDGGTQDRFTSWSAGGAASNPPQGTDFSFTVPLAAGSYTASYGRYYLLTSTVNPAGTGTITLLPATPDGYLIAGTPLTVSAAPNSGYAFSTFLGVASNPTGSSFSQSLQAPLTFSAQFTPGGTYTVTTSLNASGTETVDGKVYNGPAALIWDVGTAHTFSVPAEIDASTGMRYLFTSWSDGITTTSRRIGADATTTTYVANYQTQYLVTTAVSPAGAGTVAGGGWYNKGTSASLQVTATAGFQFSSFSGDLAGSQNPGTLTVGKPDTVVANFQPGTPTLYASAGPRIDNDPQISNFTFVLNDSGVGAAVNAQIDSVTATPSLGSGTISVPGLPLAFGTILPGQSGAQTININWPNTATRVGFTVHFSANGGIYHGQSTFYVFR